MFELVNYDFSTNIHLYKFKETNILLDVNSGAVHILDDLAARLIYNLVKYQGDFYRAMEDCFGLYDMDEVTETVYEILGLWEDGSLFTEKDESFVLDFSRLQIKALCLNVAHLCNMKCEYCFASQGDFNTQKALMSIEVAQNAIDFLLAQSQGRRFLEVDFFGGEPLLNMSVIEQTVHYARRRGAETGQQFNFTLTTNGVLLTDVIMDFIIANDISIILSLDGRREVNDRHRILNNGQGSYDIVLPHIKKAIARNPISYYVRGTFTRNNLGFSQDVQHMAEQGIKSLSMEPAVGPDGEFSIRREDLPEVLKEYEKLTEVLINYYDDGHPLEFFHFNLDLQKGPCLAKRMTGCGAGTEYLVITPEGDIYPCHQFVGHSEFYMGNLQENHIDENIGKIFAANHLENKTECTRCWARYFCGGGCHANNYFRNQDISMPDEISCEMHKKRVEAAIYMEVYKRQ